MSAASRDWSRRTWGSCSASALALSKASSATSVSPSPMARSPSASNPCTRPSVGGARGLAGRRKYGRIAPQPTTLNATRSVSATIQPPTCRGRKLATESSASEGASGRSKKWFSTVTGAGAARRESCDGTGSDVIWAGADTEAAARAHLSTTARARRGRLNPEGEVEPLQRGPEGEAFHPLSWSRRGARKRPGRR